MIIELTPKQLKQCIEFSYESAKNQQEIEFGQSDTKPRSKDEIARDNLIGKVAEVAFSNMLEERFCIKVALDFEYYPRGIWDNYDAEINGWRIDVKGTRQGGKWLLIEWSKLKFRQQEGKLAHLYVASSVFWDREKDVPTGKVDVVGCVSILRLRPHVKDTLVLRKGDYIPNTKMRLQADNYAIHFNNLEKDWTKVINYVFQNDPPDVSNYPNPYELNGG